MQLELPRAARYGSSRQQGRYDAAETGFGPDCKDRQVLRSPVLSSDGKILFVISGSGDSVVRVDSATGQLLPTTNATVAAVTTFGRVFKVQTIATRASSGLPSSTGRWNFLTA